MEIFCLYCGIKLIGNKKKYCSDLHRYRHRKILEDKPMQNSLSQTLRLIRARSNARKRDVRYNWV